jgi:hypothetical protein
LATNNKNYFVSIGATVSGCSSSPEGGRRLCYCIAPA